MSSLPFKLCTYLKQKKKNAVTWSRNYHCLIKLIFGRGLSPRYQTTLPAASLWKIQRRWRSKSHRVRVNNILQRRTQLGQFHRLLQWRPDSTNVVRIYRADFESDMVVKTTVAVFKYHWAPTTRLSTPWNDVMNTVTWSFPTFLGLQNWKSAEMMSKSDVVNRKWQVSLLLMLLANAYCVGHGAVSHNLTGSGWFYYSDPTLLSFPTFPGLPQPLLCRNDDYIGHSWW